jgi:hypothetical protein
MKFSAFSCFLIGFVVVASVSAKPPRGPKEGEVPFFCGTEVWRNSFEEVNTRYVKATNQIVWTLKAKKNVRLPSLVAFIGDGDNVELATFSVRFNLVQLDVKAGTELQATVSLGSISPKDVGNMTLRVRR